MQVKRLGHTEEWNLCFPIRFVQIKLNVHTLKTLTDHKIYTHTHTSLFEFSRIYSVYICLFSHSFYYLRSHINPHFYYNMGQKVKRRKRKIINYLNSGRRITVSCCCSRVFSRWNINLSISTSFANILSPV